MQAKTSFYNFFIELEGGNVLAYNSLSNSLAEVEQDKFPLIKEILENPNQADSGSKENIQLKESLLRGSFLVDSDLNELELLKMKNRIGRFASGAVTFTIAPTMQCNFKCNYCFENQVPVSMNEETEKATIEYIKKNAENQQVINISWFGGEPTLALETIQRISNEIRQYCEQSRKKLYPMSITTNGYLLTGESAELLKECGIKRAQVTIDGVGSVHDSRRKLKNGQGTFDTILRNIKEVMNTLDIHVRINVDKENAHLLDDLFDYFKDSGIWKRVPFYFGYTQANTESCADIATSCFNSQEKSENEVSLIKKAREKGFNNYKYPSSRHSGFCSADSLHGYVIGPSGLIFKCWSELSTDTSQSIGSVFSGSSTSIQINNLAKYINWDPFRNEECLECKLLPVCSGGCPYNGMTGGNNKSCSTFKFNLTEMLKLMYENKIKINRRKK